MRRKRAILDDRRGTFEDIVARVNTRIDQMPVHVTRLTYKVPALIFGKPSYDLSECVDFVKRHFQTEGLEVFDMGNATLVFDWTALMAPPPARAVAPAVFSRFTAPPVPGLDGIKRRLGTQKF